MNPDRRPALPAEQVVLVLQGGGALGAYQAGVYQGLHEAGVEPTWVVGTSIGAINAALICGNKPEDRLRKLQEFWSRVGYEHRPDAAWWCSALAAPWSNLNTMLRAFQDSRLNPQAVWGRAPSSAPIARPSTARSRSGRRWGAGRLRHHQRSTGSPESRRQCRHRRHEIFRLQPDADRDRAHHGVGRAAAGLSSSPVDGEPFWDGGVYSNTPIEWCSTTSRAATR